MIKNKFHLLSFLLCTIVIFAYQALLSPTLSAILRGESFHMVLSPTWFLFSLGCFVSLLQSLRFKIKNIILITTLSPLFSLGAIRFLQIHTNNQIIQALQTVSIGENSIARKAVAEVLQNYLWPISLTAAIPFFFYGFLVTRQFQFFANKKNKLLSFELLGILSGFFLTTLLISQFNSWILVVRCIAAVCFIQLIFFTSTKIWIKGICFLLSVGIYFLVPFLEPQINLNISARDYFYTKKIISLKKSWNTFSKVETLSDPNENNNWKKISISEGIGHASVFSYGNNNRDQMYESALLANVNNPQKALILFSGAAAEMIQLDSLRQGQTHITGVEINPQVLEHIQYIEGVNSDLFFKQKHIRQMTIDARSFLEIDKNTYDTILFSHAGSTETQYAGAILHTTQYTLTEEALNKAWDKLNANGFLILFPGSKLSQLATARKWKWNFDSVLYAKESDRDWKKGWEDHILIFKKGSLTTEEKQEIDRILATEGYFLAASSDTSDPDFIFHQRLISGEGSESVLKDIYSEHHLVFGGKSDDHPFVYNIYPARDFFKINFWKDYFTNWKWNQILSNNLNLSIFFIFVTIGLFLFFIFIDRGQKFSNATNNAIFLLFLGFVPAGLQILFFYRINLLFNTPLKTILIGTIICVTSSMLANISVQNKKINKYIFAIFSVGCLGLFGFLYFPIQNLKVLHNWYSFSMIIQITVCVLIFSPAFFAINLLFPYYLKISGIDTQVGRLIAFDAFGTALAYLIVPMFVIEFGIHFSLNVILGIILIGFLVIIIPRKLLKH